MEIAVEIVKGISHQRGAKRARRKKEEEEEEKVAEEEGGGARQAGEQAFSVHRKISQPGRGPMPVNSVGRSLTR